MSTVVAAANLGITVTVTGTESVIAKVKLMRKKVMRMRTTGVSRVGGYLLEEKKKKVKDMLYSGQEIGPNKFRYGLRYLGGPAKTKFTGATLRAHRLGRRVNAATDRIEVVLDTTQAPHAALIHGEMDNPGFFINNLLGKGTLVKQRPWMKITVEERAKAKLILRLTYQGRGGY